LEKYIALMLKVDFSFRMGKIQNSAISVIVYRLLEEVSENLKGKGLALTTGSKCKFVGSGRRLLMTSR
jgi:hypothetical protein